MFSISVSFLHDRSQSRCFHRRLDDGVLGCVCLFGLVGLRLLFLSLSTHTTTKRKVKWLYDCRRTYRRTSSRRSFLVRVGGP